MIIIDLKDNRKLLLATPEPALDEPMGSWARAPRVSMYLICISAELQNARGHVLDCLLA